MFRTFILALFLLCGLTMWSQEKELDSIREVLKTYKVQDSNRVSMLIDLTKYHHTRVIDSALPLIEEAIEVSKKINYKKGEGYSLNALSTFNILKGNFDKATEAAMEARAILTEINDTDNLIFNNNLLARIYAKGGELDKALELNLENIKLVENKPSSDSKAGFHFYAGKAYQEKGDFDKAELYYTNALNISKEAEFQTGIIIAQSTLGAVYLDKKEFKKALSMAEKSLEFYEKYEQQHNIANTQLVAAQAYAGLKKYPKAIDLNSKAINIYEELSMFPSLKDAYLLQSKFHSSQEEFKKSNSYLKLHYAIVDSLFSQDKLKIVEDLQAKYETDKINSQKEAAEAKTKLVEAKNERNQYFLIGAVVIAGLILLSSLFFFGRLRAQKKAELITVELHETQKRLALEKQYRDSELKALKAQMNPHFIFNALNSIQEYIILNKKNLAGDYLGMFADLMRKYLHHSDAGTLSIQDEIESLEMYLDLEKLRFEDTLSFDFKVSEAIEKETTHIPTMLIQPYIENALKHGLLHKKEDRKLWVSFENDDHRTIVCTIEDNGVGRIKAAEIKAQTKNLHRSFATKATENRLDLLNYGKDRKIGVKIIDLQDDDGVVKGTKVILTIPTTQA